jgi:hypothetical protein
MSPNVRKLPRTNKSVLDVRMRLRARRAKPISEIAVWILIEIDQVGVATID